MVDAEVQSETLDEPGEEKEEEVETSRTPSLPTQFEPYKCADCTED